VSKINVKRLDQWFSTWGLCPTSRAWQNFGGAWRMKTLWNNFAKWKDTWECKMERHFFTIKLIG